MFQQQTLSSSAASTKPGRCLRLQVGVKAPGTAKSTTCSHGTSFKGQFWNESSRLSDSLLWKCRSRLRLLEVPSDKCGIKCHSTLGHYPAIEDQAIWKSEVVMAAAECKGAGVYACRVGRVVGRRGGRIQEIITFLPFVNSSTLMSCMFPSASK